MTCVRASLVALGAALLLASPALHAAPAREALVIGNGTYSALAPLPACLLSAHAVAAALRALDFHVVEREDVSSGGADAAIGEFAAQVAAAPGAAAFIYSCGYATSFNDRPFLAPVSARIARAADVLTQGILAKSLIDVLARGGAGPSVVAIRRGADARGARRPPSRCLGPGQPAGRSGPDRREPGEAAGCADPARRFPGGQSEGSGGPGGSAAQRRPAAGRRQPIGDIGGVPATGRAGLSRRCAAASAAGPIAHPPRHRRRRRQGRPPRLPADEQLTDSDRRRVQIALVRLGYYDGRIDGVFGPDSRAAIRRYQHELGADMTGRLTAAQATRLVGGP